MTNNKLNPKPKPAKYDALSVAKYLLSLDPNREYFSDKRMKNKLTLRTTTVSRFRLHQMLYLLQILYYLEYKQLLFKDSLYAWENGIVVYKVYTHFWELYHKFNGKKIKNIEEEETKKFIKKCFSYLRTLPNQTLQEFSYNDPAWSDTWTKSDQPNIHFTNEKNLEDYQNYYSHWLHEVKL